MIKETIKKNKLTSMEIAISTHVKDGDKVVLGAALEPCIPFSASHEIIRQGKKDLTLIGPISDMIFDQIIGAGCVERIMVAWCGNVIMGSGYNLRRAVEEGIPRRIVVEDHTNFSIALGLHAGALGIPFIPTKTLLGSDIMKSNPNFKEMRCPYSGEILALVPAIVPDVSIIHGQCSDQEGNCHFWGSTGVAKDACMASKRVIVVVEEIVPKEVITSDPSRTLVPGFLVDAVVHEPWGAHPSPVQGYYNRDHQHFVQYHQETKEREGFLRWLDKWVLGVKDRKEYLKILGEGKIKELEKKKSSLSHPVDYGF